MSRSAILYPAFAMFTLTAFALARLGVMRLAAVRRREIRLRFFELYRGDDETDRLRVASRHVSNLFEVPPLFYVAVILIYATNLVSPLFVTLAWSYVGLRFVHSAIHLTTNNITHRFSIFVLSSITLVVIWVALAIRVVGADLG